MARPKRDRHDDSESQSEFIRLVENYLTSAKWTKEQFMAEIKVGEAQFYRWRRGENVPTKSIVNRIAIFLARCLDEVHQKLPHDPFPYTDKVDGLLNELLEAAGYVANVRGKEIDACWEEIKKNRSWKLGYTEVDPEWIKIPERAGDKPTGRVIDFAKRVGDLLGISTEWKYVPWEKMPLAIEERQVHGIAPFMLVAPERFFDYQFSEPWLGGNVVGLSAVTLPQKFKEESYLEDLPRDSFELVYVKNEIGSWMISILGNSYKSKDPFNNKDDAFGYLKSFEKKENGLVPILCIDSLIGEAIAENNSWQIIPSKSMKDLNLYPAFAFHREESKLITTVNTVLRMVNKIEQK